MPPTVRIMLTARLTRVAQAIGFDCAVRLCAATAAQVLSYAEAHPDGCLYFLDIELDEDMNGLAVARQLHTLDPRGYIVFVTAYEHYVWDAFYYMRALILLAAAMACGVILINQFAGITSADRIQPIAVSLGAICLMAFVCLSYLIEDFRFLSMRRRNDTLERQRQITEGLIANAPASTTRTS